MPRVPVNGIHLSYEEAGQGVPLLFVHEFAGDARSWHPQVRHFARRYRTIAFNARGYPPSDVPEDPGLYSQDHAVEDIRGLLDALGIERAHVCGLSMGGYATLLFGLRHAARARSLVVAGCGYGSVAADRQALRTDAEAVARRLETDAAAPVAEVFSRAPIRVPFEASDPSGSRAFHARSP